MKSSRERTMAFVILSLVGVTLAGLLYFMYYDRNMSRLAAEQRRARLDVDQANKSLEDIETSMPRLKAATRLSLPKDVDTARRLYLVELEKLLRASDFPIDKMNVASRQQQDTRAAGTSKKQQPFQRLTYHVKSPGTLRMLTEFLDVFYRTPLLHRIKTLEITRPVTKSAGQMPGELDIDMTVEALIVEGAEDRQTLLAEGIRETDRAPRLARDSSAYATIAGNNIFFGPPSALGPPPELAQGARAAASGAIKGAQLDDAKKPDYDILPETWISSITIDDKGPVVTVFDSINEYTYTVKRRYDGTFRVDKTYLLNGAKKPLEIGEKTLAFRDAAEYLHREFSIVRIDINGLVLEEKDKLYFLQAGHRVSDIRLLAKDEALKMGLTITEEKKDDAGKSKPPAKSDKRGDSGKEKSTPKKDEGR